MKKKLLLVMAGIGLAVGVNGQWSTTVHLPDMNSWSSQAGFIEWYGHTNNTPNGQGYGNGVQFLLGHDNRWGAQLVIPTFDQNVYFRNYLNGTWNNWVKVWHSNNLNRSDVDFTAQNMNANGNIQAGGNSNGYAILTQGDANNAGYIQIYKPNTTRIGYIGYGLTDLQYIAESSNSGHLFYTSALPRMYINSTGNVLIGKTTQTNTTYKLDVAGKIRADEITVNTTGADFVFAPTYKLRTLAEVETFIKANKHLPDIAPAAEMQTNGVSMGDMQAKLLQKVEELTLYSIEQEKKLQEQGQENAEMQLKLAKQEQELKELKELVMK